MKFKKQIVSIFYLGFFRLQNYAKLSVRRIYHTKDIAEGSTLIQIFK
jgi:hypothetical protein